jgi:hypothetical protein
MSTPGLSLVGFMTDQLQVFQHLRLQCVPADPSDAALVAEWDAARAKRGGPRLQAGVPSVLPIPASENAYVQQLRAQPWVQEAFRMFGYGAADFKLVEIDPLLAHQFTVDKPRSDHHCAALKSPTVADLMPICLPQAQPKPNDLSPMIDGPNLADPNDQKQTFIVKVRNLNMRRLSPGIFSLNQNGYDSWVMGLQVHVALPFVHVVRFNSRYYLHNGFHRAFGVRMAGAAYIPCLVRDATSQQDAGIIGRGQTFPLDLLESLDPPTLGHFTQGKAYDVRLRSGSRIFHVNWSETVMPDEYERMNP